MKESKGFIIGEDTPYSPEERVGPELSYGDPSYIYRKPSSSDRLNGLANHLTDFLDDPIIVRAVTRFSDDLIQIYQAMDPENKAGVLRNHLDQLPPRQLKRAQSLMEQKITERIIR
ncbi:hypothetical protein HYS93_00970 [Candidatus Daviesbacteria bacterium]|nr:hypothetical protein [Candidatus Daviesbacteria bacterium]